MAVEDEEPLTHQEQSEGGGGKGRQSGASPSIETILSSALHKHAARKLGKVQRSVDYLLAFASLRYESILSIIFWSDGKIHTGTGIMGIYFHFVH